MKKILFLSAIDFKEKSIKVISETPKQYVKKGWIVDYFVYRDTAKTGNYFYEDEINPEGVNVYRKYWPFARIRNLKSRSLRLLISKLSSISVTIGLFKSGVSYLKENKDCNLVYGYEMQGVLASNLLKLVFFKRQIFYISRFQGVFYIKEHFKNKRYLNLIFNIDTLLALWLPSNLMIMTNDGTQGEAVLKKIKSRSLKNLLFISNGVNSPEIISRDSLLNKYKLNKNNSFILMVSRLVKIKRVHLALETLKYLKEKRIPFNYKLVIVGDGPELEKLKAYAVDSNIINDVVFLGALPNEEVYSLMKYSEMVISLYESSNIGNPFFESMSVGTPFIAVDNGDTSSFIKHMENGYLLSEDNIVLDLVRFFVELNSSYSELSLEGLKNGAYNYSKKHLLSWEDRIQLEIDKIEELYQKDLSQ